MPSSYAIEPLTIAAASSGVALARSLAASLGSSLRDWNKAKCPSDVKMIGYPSGFAPKGSTLLPLAS